METIDYMQLSVEAEKIKNKALAMIIDPKTKIEQMENIYYMLEVSEMAIEHVEKNKLTKVV